MYKYGRPYYKTLLTNDEQ